MTFSPNIAYSEYIKRLLAYTIAGLTAFTMSAYFVIGYFVGNIKFWTWNEDQWLHAIPGTGICIALTVMQLIVYSMSKRKGWKAFAGTAVAILVCGCFALLTEVGQGMERDEIRMTTKSAESPTLKALTGSLSTAATSTYNPYSRNLQQAEMRLSTCYKRVEKGTYTDCKESEANVRAVKEMISMSEAANTTRAVTLAATAKTMERDESNYHPTVNLIKSWFEIKGIIASFTISLMIIFFFEYAFHYLGRRLAEARDELYNHGYDVRILPRFLNPKLLDNSNQNASDRNENGSQNGSSSNTPKANTEKRSEGSQNGSERAGTPASSLAEVMDDPDQFAVLQKYVRKPVFSEAFIAIATGEIKCSQGAAKKKFKIGGEFTYWIMLILEACETVTEPNANGMRELIKPLSEREAGEQLGEVLTLILGETEAREIANKSLLEVPKSKQGGGDEQLPIQGLSDA